MKSPVLMTSSALALLLVAGTGAHAATCNMVGTQITCTDPGSAPIVSATDNVRVIVNAGASVVSDDEDVAPVALSGDAAEVENAGTIEQSDTSNGGYAITGSGTGLTVINTDQILSADRGIEMLAGSDLRVINEVGALISSRRQAVRSGTDAPNAYVENHGTISSSDGRAVQVRSFGATVINYGELIGGEEVVEARGGFTLENYGTIRLSDPSIEDEDGVQFAGGTVYNEGSITGSDDGIDVDEGTITNTSTGVIRSTAPDTNSNSGIDIDEVYDDGVSPERVPGLLTINNAGLIEGPSAIGADDASVSQIVINNSGQLTGRGGTAVRFAEGQGDSTLAMTGASVVQGDVYFGAGNDLVEIGGITSGVLVDGTVYGRAGVNMVSFLTAALADFTFFEVNGARVDVSFMSNGDVLSGTFIDFDTWDVGGRSYTSAEFAATILPETVPLPAGLPLLLAGLGGLALLRRRKAT